MASNTRQAVERPRPRQPGLRPELPVKMGVSVPPTGGADDKSQDRWCREVSKLGLGFFGEPDADPR